MTSKEYIMKIVATLVMTLWMLIFGIFAF